MESQMKNTHVFIGIPFIWNSISRDSDCIHGKMHELAPYCDILPCFITIHNCKMRSKQGSTDKKVGSKCLFLENMTYWALPTSWRQKCELDSELLPSRTPIIMTSIREWIPLKAHRMVTMIRKEKSVSDGMFAVIYYSGEHRVFNS